MVERSGGVIERLFDCLIAGDWAGYSALLSPDAERIGAWGERTVGRERYVEMMAGPSQGNTWEVHRIAYTPDGRSGFARVTAHVVPGRAPFEQFEETLAFEIDDAGLVCRVEVFWQTPWITPTRV